jgi:hypothetical protein
VQTKDRKNLNPLLRARDLPPEILAEVGIVAVSDDVRIVALFREYQSALNLDEILIGLYDGDNQKRDRKTLTQTITRMCNGRVLRREKRGEYALREIGTADPEEGAEGGADVVHGSISDLEEQIAAADNDRIVVLQPADKANVTVGEFVAAVEAGILSPGGTGAGQFAVPAVDGIPDGQWADLFDADPEPAGGGAEIDVVMAKKKKGGAANMFGDFMDEEVPI